MIASPLELERAFFTQVNLRAGEAAEVTGPGGYATEVQMGHDGQDRRRVLVALTVTLQAPETGVASYLGEVRAVALLRIATDVDEKKMHQLAAVHGASLLYGMIREQICSVTARGPWPMFTLPTANFSDLDIDPEPPK